uniref:Uncharacterized protein n=1 Tax=Panagrolaimus sp. JU765 TaxID=591449 RepID=A0AC34PY43_9BILA
MAMKNNAHSSGPSNLVFQNPKFVFFIINDFKIGTKIVKRYFFRRTCTLDTPLVELIKGHRIATTDSNTPLPQLTTVAANSKN